jgi:hypothetical protein
LLVIHLNQQAELGAAIFDAYDWPHELSDEEILARLPAVCPSGYVAKADSPKAINTVCPVVKACQRQ